MKKKLILFSIVFPLILIAVFTSASANTVKNEGNEQWIRISLLDKNAIEKHEEAKTLSSKLPESLTTIESNAFEGTAFISIEIPENVAVIGDYAFANIETLKAVRIPNNTQYIGINAFKGSNNVTITGAPKGYARAYAQENGIPFNPITSFYAYDITAQIMGLNSGKTEEQKLLLDGEATEEDRHRNPTGRMAGELNADKYETITAFHIQGRAPPMG